MTIKDVKENLPEKETSSNLHYLVEGKYLTDYDEWTHNTEGLIHQSILFPVVYLRTKNRKSTHYEEPLNWLQYFVKCSPHKISKHFLAFILDKMFG